MLWRIAAVILAVGSVIGAVVRLQQGEYLYLFASIGGLCLAVWMWEKGRKSATEPDGDPATR